MKKTEHVQVKVCNLHHEPLDAAYTFQTLNGKDLWWPESAMQIIGYDSPGVAILSVKRELAERNGLI